MAVGESKYVMIYEMNLQNSEHIWMTTKSLWFFTLHSS